MGNGVRKLGKFSDALFYWHKYSFECLGYSANGLRRFSVAVYTDLSEMLAGATSARRRSEPRREGKDTGWLEACVDIGSDSGNRGTAWYSKMPTIVPLFVQNLTEKEVASTFPRRWRTSCRTALRA